MVLIHVIPLAVSTIVHMLSGMLVYGIGTPYYLFCMTIEMKDMKALRANRQFAYTSAWLSSLATAFCLGLIAPYLDLSSYAAAFCASLKLWAFFKLPSFSETICGQRTFFVFAIDTLHDLAGIFFVLAWHTYLAA